MSIHPYPWGSLESLTRAEVSVLRAVRRWAAEHVRLDALEGALGAVASVTLRVRARRVKLLSRARAFGEGYGVLLGGDDVGAGTREALLQVETALATTLVARATGRAPPVVQRIGAESPAIAGALAALIAAAARRAHASTPLRVVWAGSASEAQARLGSTP